MKKYIKRNQVLITALAIMIAVAGYLSFQDKKTESEETALVAQNDGVLTYDLSLEEFDEEDIFCEEEMESVSGNEEEALDEIGDVVPGEAVFTSTQPITSLSGAKLLKEQTRAKNRETLLQIINNTNISEEAKVDAIAAMVMTTEITEKETNAEIMLEAKGFQDAVVSVSEDTVDVCVVTEELTDAQRAQIEDIVQRKTGVSAENIIITTVW